MAVTDNRLKESFEGVQEDIITQMHTLCKVALYTFGVDLSFEEQQRLRGALYEYVTRSVEIEAKLIAAIERTPLA